MRTGFVLALAAVALLRVSGCTQAQCQFEERPYALTIGDPYTGPAAPTLGVPSCGVLGETAPGQIYLFDVATVNERPSCHAEGVVSGDAIRDVVATSGAGVPLLSTQERAPHEYVVTLPSGCRGVWAIDIGIDGDGAAYFGRTFSPLSGPCPDIPPRTGAVPPCADFYTATLMPR